MTNCGNLKNLLVSENYTCVLSNGDDTVSSREKGVRPLIEFIDSGKDFSGYAAADKIVGKAAALLYAHMKVTELYAEVASREAADVCAKYGIALSSGTLTEKIINRRGDDICPMEKTVADITDPLDAYRAIKIKFSLTQRSDLG